MANVNRDSDGVVINGRAYRYLFSTDGSVDGGEPKIMEVGFDTLEECNAHFRALIKRGYVGDWPSVVDFQDTESLNWGFGMEWDDDKGFVPADTGELLDAAGRPGVPEEISLPGSPDGPATAE